MLEARCPTLARNRRGPGSAVAVLIMAVGCAAALVAAAAATSPGPSPDRVQLSRAEGKLGPALQARLTTATIAAGEGWTDAELRLTIIPGFDSPGCAIEFILPPGSAALDGQVSRSLDLVAGREEEHLLSARMLDGAGGAAAARVTAGGMSREIYAAASDGIEAGLRAGRLETDSAGNRIRVFQAGERGGR